MDEPDRGGTIWDQTNGRGAQRSSRWAKAAWIAAVAGILLVGTGWGVSSSSDWEALISGGFAALYLGIAALINAGAFALFARHSTGAIVTGIILLVVSIVPVLFAMLALKFMICYPNGY